MLLQGGVWKCALTLIVLAACGRPAKQTHATEDFSATRDAIDHYVAEGRTPTAFAELANVLDDARHASSGAAQDAEVRLLALARSLAEGARSSALDEQLDTHALTLWPVLLADPLTVEATHDMAPRAGETAASYVARLCHGELARACGGLEPEQQAIVIRGIAMQRASDRMRTALTSCLRCNTETGWRELGWQWESLATNAARDVAELHLHPQVAVAGTR